MNQQYLIAVDAGGTKTEAVRFAPDGTVAQRILTHGINPLVGSFEATCADTLALLAALAAEHTVSHAYVGIPALQYFGGRIEKHLREHCDFARVRAEADGFMLISAALGPGDGAAMVCGTGSGLYIRDGERKYGIGGWGYILDGCGSGFVLGRRALRAVVRQADGRGEKTLLTELANARMGGDVTQLLPEIYAGGRPCFASFAQTVFEARRRGDAVAERIFNDCADDLAEMVLTAHRQSPLRTLVLNGGIFQHFPEYIAALQARIPAEITLSLSDVPPLYGAAVEAMHDAGLACDDAFKARFLSTRETAS